MPYKNKDKQLRYMRWWRRNHKTESRDYMRVYRAKKKLKKESEEAVFNYYKKVLPVESKNWRIEQL